MATNKKNNYTIDDFADRWNSPIGGWTMPKSTAKKSTAKKSTTKKTTKKGK